MRLGCAAWVIIILLFGWLALPWYFARTYTLTDRRVIVRKGILWKSENSIPLRNIQDVTVSYGPLSGMVIVVSAGGAIVFPPVPVAAAREFADAYARVSGGAAR
jgi:membrane protein YdbS with pleckstrin-like domain